MITYMVILLANLHGHPFDLPIWLSFWSTPISAVTMRCVILLIFFTSLCHFLIYMHADGIWFQFALLCRSIRTSEDIISIWNRTADNVEANDKIR